jgi:DNA-binding transcriptional MerR regulator
MVGLPQIPAKSYFTIGEVAQLCDVKPHVLRYWEQEFSQIKPAKRRGNRRYYQHHEVLLIRKIRELLYEHGFTIQGARNQLQEKFRSPQLEVPQLSPTGSAGSDVQPRSLMAAAQINSNHSQSRLILQQAPASLKHIHARDAQVLKRELQEIRKVLTESSEGAL